MALTPPWQKEIENFVGIKSAFIIEGNVHDRYPFYETEAPGATPAFLELEELLPRLFERGAARKRPPRDGSGIDRDMSAPTSRRGTYDPGANQDDTAPVLRQNQIDAPENQGIRQSSALNGQSRVDAPAYRFLYCDPLRGMTNPLGDPALPDLLESASREADRLRKETEALNPSRRQESYADNRLVHNSLIVRAALTRRLEEQRGIASRLPFAGRPGGTRSAPQASQSDLGTTPQASQPGRPLAEPSPTASPSNETPARPQSIACVFSFASRLSARPSDLSAEENAVFMNLMLGVMDSIRGDGANRNTLILVVNKVADVPPWFFAGNPDVRTIALPNPDRACRAAFVAASFPALQPSAMDKQREKFIDVTDSMKLAEVDELRRLALKSNTMPADMPQLVDVYKYGIKENRWADVADKLREDPEEALRRRVKGQDRAIEKIVTVLKRSVMGFSGMQHSSGTKPKGVLFLAGPTGTGKTEVVKAVTELLFGDERSYLRFDMSEYSSENSDQKLFGAPPGYVGYEQGGQLTNAVKSNPFSVLLFDEIEKAHPSIMDKFLQILEDGRMTDGQGNTVYFSETIIFFTSNVGISEEVLDEHGRAVGRRNIVQPGEPYDQIEQKVKDAMAVHFKPEVLNRIGENIVVFDYISEEASGLIVRAQLGKIAANVAARSGIRVDVADSCIAWFCREALAPEVREKGGRGIGNLVEARFLNPLASFVFDRACRQGDTVRAEASNDGVAFTKA